MAHHSSESERQGTILDVEQLHVKFAHENGLLQAVRGLSFSLAAGEALAIVGESGSGKSATAMAIMGLLPASAQVGGSIRLLGSILDSRSDKSMSHVRGNSMAMVFQDPLSSMTPVYTVGEQIVESILIHNHCSIAEAQQRAIDLLDLVGIGDPKQRMHAYPHEFSGGMRQRAMIAMAIANNPQVLIADEPTTALDVTMQAQILDVLQRACRELNAALILITHDLGIVARVADRAIVMYAGKAVEQADVSVLFTRSRMPYTLGLLGSLPGATSAGNRALTTIPGYPPSLESLPSGCPFAPRCPIADAECQQEEPSLQPTDNTNHHSACLHHQIIASESLGHADLFSAQIPAEPGPDAATPDRRSLLLELSAMKKHYPLFKGSVFRRQTGTVYAVDGIDLQLYQGETLALVGESGCGKSTTAMAVLELQKPTSGSIKIFNHDVCELQEEKQRKAMRRLMQVVFQDPVSSLDPRMPVFDLIAEPLGVFNLPTEQIDSRVSRLLDLVGLNSSYAERYPQQLSGGQCQRVCIARALALEPQLLILDEPVSALDVSIRAGIINLLQTLKNSLGLSYLFITHDLALVRHFADRVAVMYLGQVLETGAADSVCTNPAHPYTRCLISAAPVPDPAYERDRQRILPKGELPSAVNPPRGCRFHTRCPKKTTLTLSQQNLCVSETPRLRQFSSIKRVDTMHNNLNVHQCACHFSA